MRCDLRRAAGVRAIDICRRYSSILYVLHCGWMSAVCFLLFATYNCPLSIAKLPAACYPQSPEVRRQVLPRCTAPAILLTAWRGK
jgi:hypothetical protein